MGLGIRRFSTVLQANLSSLRHPLTQFDRVAYRVYSTMLSNVERVDDSFLHSSGETGGRVHCDPLVHRRPTSPFLSIVESKSAADKSVQFGQKLRLFYFRCNTFLPVRFLDSSPISDHFSVYVEFKIKIRM